MERQIGIDEVGRGCLAGDLVVCAFAFHPCTSASVRRMAMDSKAFSSRARREAAAAALRDAGEFVLVRRTPEEIAAHNIRGAVLSAFVEAAAALRARIGEGSPVIVDGRDLPDIPPPARAQIKGDVSVSEIGAASVLAKTVRDREMVAAAELYPGYGFEAHVGYATQAHREALRIMGMTPIHRTWAEKFVG